MAKEGPTDVPPKDPRQQDYSQTAPPPQQTHNQPPVFAPAPTGQHYPPPGPYPQYPPGQHPPPYAYGAAPLYRPAPGSSPEHERAKLPGAGPSSTGQREYANRWQDTWAGFLFVLHFFALQGYAIYLAVLAVQQTVANNNAAPPPPNATGYDYDIRDWLAPLGLAIATGLVFSWLWLQLIKLAPRTMIHVSLWWGVVVSLALGGLLLATSEQTRFIGIVFLLGGLLQIFYAIAVRPRIPFAGAMLRQASQVVRTFPSTVWVSYLALLVSLEWIVVWTIGAVGATSQTNSLLIIFLMLLSLFWTMEVIRNTVHVTTAGTVATYYFQRQNMPPNPTGRALGRALTKSFGSICLGSFIVAFLQASRNIVASLRAQNQDSAAAAILASCAECILSCIEALVRYFNKWAYVQVAVYGKPFVRAARDTWDLFQAQGFHLVINDDLVMGVLFMGCLIGGIVTALVAGVWTYLNVEEIAAAVALLAFFIGYFMTYLTMAVIESAVCSYYVCYAEDPAALQRNDPGFYEVIRERHTFLMQN